MKSRLKIGMVSYRSNPHCGGQGVYIRHLSRAMADLGHDVEVIAGPPDPLLNGNVSLTMLPTLDLYNPKDLFRTPSLKELKDPVNLIEWLDVSAMGYPEPMTFGMRLKRHLKNSRTRYDILHDNQSLSYGLLSLAKHMPVIATIHHPMTVDRRLAVKSAGTFFGKVKAMRWYSFIAMQKKVAQKLPAIITVSKSSMTDISAEYKVDTHRFKTIPIGIDLDSFYPLEGIRKKPDTLITTNSADTPLKGLGYLLSAIKKILKKRAATLVVVGEPKKDGTIQKMVKKLGLSSHVRFTGRIDQEQFLKEYAAAGIAVVPSIYEGFGLPVGEAMACRVPVICTTGGALPEVAGDAARLVPPADSGALADAILELMADANLRETLAQKGYDRVLSEFTWEKCARRTVQAYREIIRDYHQIR